MKLVTMQFTLPPDLHAAAVRQAARQGVSFDHFVALAIGARLDATEIERYFAERRARADMDAFRRILNRTDGEPPRPDDLIDED